MLRIDEEEGDLMRRVTLVTWKSNVWLIVFAQSR